MSRQFCRLEDHPEIHVSTFHLFLKQIVIFDAQNSSILHCASIYELTLRIWDPIVGGTIPDQISTMKKRRPFCHKNVDNATQMSLQETKNDDQNCAKIYEIKLTTK